MCKVKTPTLSPSRIPYLEWRHTAGIHHVVQILMDSVEQPKQELLGIVLGVPTVLHRILGHDVLQRGEAVQQQLMQT